MKQVNLRITQKENELNFRIKLIVKDLKELADLFIKYKYEKDYSFLYFIEQVNNVKKETLEDYNKRSQDRGFEDYKHFQESELLFSLIRKGARKDEF